MMTLKIDDGERWTILFTLESEVERKRARKEREQQTSRPWSEHIERLDREISQIETLIIRLEGLNE